MIYSADGTALDLGFVTSPTLPVPIASEGLKDKPARNRNMMSDQMLGAKPEPIVKTAASGVEIR